MPAVTTLSLADLVSEHQRWTSSFHAGLNSAALLAQQIRAAREVTIDEGPGFTLRAELTRPAGASVDVLRIFQKLPNGRVLSVQELTLGFTASSILAQDLDQDGAVDVFATDSLFAQSALLLGSPSGDFQVLTRNSQGIAMAIADLDEDGRDEQMIAHPQADELALLRDSDEYMPLADGSSGLFEPDSLRLMDVNGDGELDLLVGTGRGSVQVYHGSAGNRFQFPLEVDLELPVGPGRIHINAAELTGDNQIDLVLASEGGDFVQLYHGENPAFLLGEKLNTGLGPRSTSLADVTGDGQLDLIVTCRGENRVWVLPGRGEGHFDQEAIVFAVGLLPEASFAGDFDGDGRIDLVTLNTGSDNLSIISDVAGVARRELVPSGGSQPIAGLVRDFDADGVDDFIVANQGDGSVVLFRGGQNSLNPVETLVLPSSRPTALLSSENLAPWQVYVVDANSDQATLLSFSYPLHVDETPPPLVLSPLLDEVALMPLTGEMGDVVPMLVVIVGVDRLKSAGNHPEAIPGQKGQDQRFQDAKDVADELLEPEVAPESESAEKSRVTDFLLGADEVAAPPVGPDGSSEVDITVPEPTLLPPPGASQTEAIEALPMPGVMPQTVATASEPRETATVLGPRHSLRQGHHDHLAELMVVLAGCGLGWQRTRGMTWRWLFTRRT